MIIIESQSGQIKSNTVEKDHQAAMNLINSVNNVILVILLMRATRRRALFVFLVLPIFIVLFIPLVTVYTHTVHIIVGCCTGFDLTAISPRQTIIKSSEKPQLSFRWLVVGGSEWLQITA